MSMLEIKDLTVYYGVICALKGISFHVDEGEIIALIGSNGAGKTTTLQTVSGMLAPESGQILFEGEDITKVPGHKIVTKGMAHVPEGRRVFAQLSVLENLRLGAYTRSDKAEVEETLGRVYKSFPRLEERKNQLAGTLSGGEQQMLAMGRALMSKPRIVLKIVRQNSAAMRLPSSNMARIALLFFVSFCILSEIMGSLPPWLVH